MQRCILLNIHVYWNILTMHGPINVKSPNNTSKWQMGFNSAFKELTSVLCGQEAVRIRHSEWNTIDSQCAANPVNVSAVSW
jgi:hypothetical protein